ncbi:MAG: sigma 54-interacting transcriptional regulator [Deltaproteobacteria bacterium]|nr:sigma 54-interacting transcriptional regulator [Deltaproteobacteria bacterium]
MKNKTVTTTLPEINAAASLEPSKRVSRIFVCHAPLGEHISDRARVQSPFTVGRSSSCSMVICDSRLSKMHFRIDLQGDNAVLEDLNSTNGTWVNGERVRGQRPLSRGSIIRAGETVFCFEQNTNSFTAPAFVRNYGIEGKFWQHDLLEQLKEAAFSERHVLICGPTGCGKELAANALTQMYSEQYGAMHMVSQNMARFSSEEEAASSLFGVATRVFTSVGARVGLIEQADGGVLFLDEIHNLPMRMQRSLLRVMEDGLFSRMGDNAPRKITVRFVFASNATEEFCGLAPDLYSRCRVIQLRGLEERRADIPAIFKSILQRFSEKHRLDSTSILKQLGSSHVEAMCLDSFSVDNVRGIIDLCDRIVTRIKNSSDVKQAIDSVFEQRFPKSPVFSRNTVTPPPDSSQLYRSEYERNRAFISDAFRKCDGNFSATERMLKKYGISCSRRWLKVYAEKWQLKI